MKESTFFHRYKEIILGVFMIALASFYLYHATLIKSRSTVSVSAKLIPEILGCLVIVLGIAQVVAGIKYLADARRQARAENKKIVFLTSEGLRNAVPVVLTFIVILLYALAFEPVGFVISSILCMFCLMLILAPKSRLQPLKFLLISAIVAVLVYFAFRKGLDLSLPDGILEGYMPF